jgi:hypothetical protein
MVSLLTRCTFFKVLPLGLTTRMAVTVHDPGVAERNKVVLVRC